MEVQWNSSKYFHCVFSLSPLQGGPSLFTLLSALRTVPLVARELLVGIRFGTTTKTHSVFVHQL